MMFPFNADPSLTFYIVVYVLTLVLHAFFMTYVLAGSAYLAWATLFPGSNEFPRSQQPLAKLLREWLPFVLSAAITAGVAPLLFVQIIYRQEFYTANLLLGWRWMVVIPVLIVAFYLLYVVKSRLVAEWSFVARSALVITISACFLFVAFCWTTNHLLQLNRDVWADVYQTSNVVREVGGLLLRLMTWFFGAFPTMAILLGWQLRSFRDDDVTANSHNPNTMTDETRRIASAAIGGLVAAMVFGTLYLGSLDSPLRQQLFSEGTLWAGLLIGSVVLQLTGWTLQLRARCLCRPRMWLVTVSNTTMLVATGFLREQLRFYQVDQEAVADSVNNAAKVGGLELFLLFTIMNVLLMAVCFRLIRGRLENVDGTA